jgi:hypothetical protein
MRAINKLEITWREGSVREGWQAFFTSGQRSLGLAVETFFLTLP